MSNTSAFAFESLTIGPKPISLSPSIYKPTEGVAEVAFITCEGECRYTYHPEGIPSSTEGHLLRDGGFILLHGELQIQNFKAVSTGSDNAKLQVSYERK